MKYLLTIFAIILSTNALADKSVKGYTRSDGTYVQGYTRSSPDSSRANNNGSKSNGGNQRDEYSSPGATNKGNSSYGSYDNDNDGVSNNYDKKPKSSSGY